MRWFNTKWTNFNSSGSDALNLKTFITDTKNKYNEEEKKKQHK